jgi:hypothetical protein
MLEAFRARVWLAMRGYGWRRDLCWVEGIGDRPHFFYKVPLDDEGMWGLAEAFQCNVVGPDYYELP